ncbi:MAG: response regulator transcription factor [Cytophagales bacterium]|jgi:two-component system response regulator LytT|nr:response regulator transcription factor [Cytophagales bacterium]MCA6388378.1 response regulator transcription factor [Cytophagales bacterium]MCA6391300.1 response regulator transcription factor [Cytophagales bacterium]MCA6393906.1 response regulator transcription factor [Cytophagales bacterium]MCA6397240.1 response regulator transcription factor [Cytophagales bacterium]
MRLVLLEDEQPALRHLKRMIGEVAPHATVVAHFDAVESAIGWFQSNADYDLIISDIQLSDGLSLAIFRQVKMTKPIIFTTAFDQYAIEAFKVNGIDYLLKPVKAEELSKAIEKYKTLFNHNNQPPLDVEKLIKQIAGQEKVYRTRLLVHFRDELKSIPVESIAFIHSENKVSHLFSKSGEMFILDQNMEELEAQLNPQIFFRANRQFIISFSSIKSNHQHFNGKIKVLLTLPTKDEVLVSRERAPEFKAWLGS